MKIKFVQSLSGSGRSYKHGEVVDLPKSDAEAYVRSGVAEAVPDSEVELIVKQLREQVTLLSQQVAAISAKLGTSSEPASPENPEAKRAKPEKASK